MRRVIPSRHKRARRVVRALLALPAALLLVATTATSASADVVKTRDEVWSNTDSSKCLYTISEASDGGGGGYAKGEGLASSGIPLSEACVLIWNRPVGQLKVGWQYFYWNGSTWGVCRQLMGEQRPDGTWSGYANTTKTSRMTVKADFGIAPPCGGGYYGTKTGSTVYYGGTWYGGNVPVWSGDHWVEP